MHKIELDIDGELMDFTIPTQWSEVTVKQTTGINDVPREGRTEIEIIADIVSVLSGIDTDLIFMMTTEQFNQVCELIQFTTTEITGELAESVMIGEEEYFLKKDFSSLTMGEIISIETIIKQNDNNIASAMAKLLCIFLRKKKDNGSLESFKNSFMEREELFEGVMITDVNNLFIFFSGGKLL